MKTNVAVCIIGKLDFETGVTFPKGFPTQAQFESVVREIKTKKPFCYGSLSTAANYVHKFFKEQMDKDTTLHLNAMYQSNSKHWNDSRF